ncbi:MAG: peptidoglycan-binding protein [Clostridia bacterium]|nr:peptidoglycan-binding protein [Clostridia bacterium]
MNKTNKIAVKVLSALLAAVIFALLCVPAYALLPDNERLPGYTMSSSYKSGVYYQRLLAVKLTGDMRKDIVAVCKSQVDYHEGGSTSSMDGTSSSSGNYTEYNNFYTAYAKSMGDSYNYINCAWCGSFVAFCMYMARVPENVLHLSAQTNPQAFGILGDKKKAGAKYKKWTETVIKGGSYTPLPGDIVFFAYSEGSSSYRHIGIVESCTFGYNDAGQKTMTVNTFEGNCSDKVKNNHWTFTADSSGRCYSGMYITGFGIPNYTTQIVDDGGGDTPPVTGDFDLGAYGGSLLKSGSTGEDVLRLQFGLNVIAWGSGVSSACPVSGTFDSNTQSAVRAYQTAYGLEVDGVVGSQTFTSLRSEVNRMIAGESGDCIVNGEGKLILYKGKSGDVVLPEGCVSIGGYAFFNAKLKTLVLPKNFKTIYSNAFYGVSSLSAVTLSVSAEEAKKIGVSSVGNDAYTNAPKTYTVKSHEITFIVGDLTKAQNFDEGTVPVYSGGTDRPADDRIWFFTGWDKPFAPVTGPATYTAQYDSIPNATVTLESIERPVGIENAFSAEITASGLVNVSSFSFEIDYSQYAGALTLNGCVACPGLDGVTVETPAEGVLRVRYEGEALSGRTELVRLDFTVAQHVVSEQICIPVCAGMNGDFFTETNGRLYAYPSNGCCVIAKVERMAYYDVDSSGVLDINDVTAALDRLCTMPAHTPGDGINAVSSIDDITRLLDVISRQQSRPHK